MKVITQYLPLFAILSLTLTGCVKEEYPTQDTPQSNLEALWRIMDEHYCFFDIKQQKLGVDWNDVRSRYQKRVTANMSDIQLFEVCCDMLSELKDGHVNLTASFDYGRNWSFWQDYPENVNDSIQRSYLGNDYHMAASLRYKILDDNIGYVSCPNFTDGFGHGNVGDMLMVLSLCRGLIIDIRGNGGGNLSNVSLLASHFTNEKVLSGYVYHKTGKGHNDFSTPEALYLEPANGTRWQKKTVVLTNRQCFSAANDFVKCMKGLERVTILGDTTGGGSGMPFTQEIPCGWSVRYSSVVYLDRNKEHTEFGIAPDVVVTMKHEDVMKKKDTLIEAAREFLKSGL
ncbi:MAG: S41 family peptidase [Bacteroidaceae bacterium]|nr:S41 family peptidase [Bacteroidaceae bacterium]